MATQSPLDVTLRDGSRVLIRPVRPEDKDLFVRGFSELSERSRYRRFFFPIQKLTDEFVARVEDVLKAKEAELMEV